MCALPSQLTSCRPVTSSPRHWGSAGRLWPARTAGMEQPQLPALPMHQVSSTCSVPGQLCPAQVGAECGRAALLREQTWRKCCNTGKILCDHHFLLPIAVRQYSRGGSPSRHTCSQGCAIPLGRFLADSASACPAAPRRIKSYTLIDFSELEPPPQSPPEPLADTPWASQRHGSTASTCLLEEDLQSLGL